METHSPPNRTNHGSRTASKYLNNFALPASLDQFFQVNRAFRDGEADGRNEGKSWVNIGRGGSGMGVEKGENGVAL